MGTLMRKQMWLVNHCNKSLVRYYILIFQWSYGVVCWEIFSLGIIPYPGLNAKEVITLLSAGERLDQPNNCACSDEM